MTLIAAWHRNGTSYVIADSVITNGDAPDLSTFGEAPHTGPNGTSAEGASKIRRIRGNVLCAVAGLMTRAERFVDLVAESDEADLAQAIAALSNIPLVDESPSPFAVLFTTCGPDGAAVISFDSVSRKAVVAPELWHGLPDAILKSIDACESEEECNALAAKHPDLSQTTADPTLSIPVFGSANPADVELIRAAVSSFQTHEPDSPARILAAAVSFVQAIAINEASLAQHAWGGTIVGGMVDSTGARWMPPITYFLHEGFNGAPASGGGMPSATSSALQQVAVGVFDNKIFTVSSMRLNRVLTRVSSPPKATSSNEKDQTVLVPDTDFVSYVRLGRKGVVVVDRSVDRDRFFRVTNDQVLLHARLYSELTKEFPPGSGEFRVLSHLSHL